MIIRSLPLLLTLCLSLSSAHASDEYPSLQQLCTTTAISSARTTVHQTPLWRILVAQRNAIALLFDEPTQTQLRQDNQFVRNALVQTYSLIFDEQNNYLHDLQEPFSVMLHTSYTCQPRVTPELTQFLEQLETVAVHATLIYPQTPDETMVQKTLYDLVACIRRLVLNPVLTQKVVAMALDEDTQTSSKEVLNNTDAADLAAQFNAVASHLKKIGAYDRWEKEKKKDSWFVRLIKVAVLAGVVYTAWRWWQQRNDDAPPPADGDTKGAVVPQPPERITPDIVRFNIDHPRNGDDPLRDLSLRIGCGRRPVYTADKHWERVGGVFFWRPSIVMTKEGEPPSDRGPGYQLWCKQLAMEIHRRVMAVFDDPRALAIWTKRCADFRAAQEGVTSREYLFNDMMCAPGGANSRNTEAMNPEDAQELCRTRGAAPAIFAPFFNVFTMRLIHVASKETLGICGCSDTEIETSKWHYDPLNRLTKMGDANYHANQEKPLWIQSEQTVNELEQALPPDAHYLDNSPLLPTPGGAERYLVSLPTCVLREHYGVEPPLDAHKRSLYIDDRLAPLVVKLADAALLARELQIKEGAPSNVDLGQGIPNIFSFLSARSDIAQWIVKTHARELFRRRRIREAPYNDARPPVMNPKFKTTLRAIIDTNPHR